MSIYMKNIYFPIKFLKSGFVANVQMARTQFWHVATLNS